MRTKKKKNQEKKLEMSDSFPFSLSGKKELGEKLSQKTSKFQISKREREFKIRVAILSHSTKITY
jgi:hypothetical protein